jgi:CRISPR-associated endonuclease Csn1
VHIALNQLRKLVNALIRRYGKPSEIIVEVGRNLKTNAKKKLEDFQAQALNQEKNEQYRRA